MPRTTKTPPPRPRSLAALIGPAAQASPIPEMYGYIFAQSPVPTMVSDIDGNFVEANEAFVSLFGYTRRELIGGRVGKVMHPMDLAEHRERMEVLRSGGAEGFVTRKRYLTKDGRTLWGESHSRVIRDAEGKPRWIVVMIFDRTEEQEAAEQAAESEKQLQAILDNSSAIIFVKDRAGRYILVNRRFEQLFRKVKAHLLGRTDRQLFDGKLAKIFRRNDRTVLLKGRDTQTEEDVTLGSEQRTFIMLKFPLRDLDGNIVAVAGMATDITQRKRSENRLKVLNERLINANEELKLTQMQLIQAEKLESIGRLAAGVAHEVKNPLALLLMGVEYLEHNVPTDDENVPIILKEMREAITRAEKIIVGMVDFSSHRQLNRETVDLHQLIDNATLLMRHQFTRKSVRLKKCYAPNLPPLFADKTRIEQVLVNLITNALQAMKKGGRLTLTTSTRILGEEDRRSFGTRTANPFRAGDRVVVLEIRDNGPGIPPELLSKVFDPFFTTKPTGEGTGLGLSVTRKIVELHEGHIELANVSEGGLKVTLTFKAQDSMLATSGTPAAPSSPDPVTPDISEPSHEKNHHRRRRSGPDSPAEAKPRKNRKVHRPDDQ